MISKQLLRLSYCLVITLVAASALISARAQSPTARSTGRVNVRSSPNLTSGIVGVLAANTEILVEARSQDSRWLLARTADNVLRGWMSVQFIALSPGVVVANLPVSTETIVVTSRKPATVPAAPPTATPDYIPTAYAPTEVASQIMTAYHLKVPILPKIDSRMHGVLKRIYAHGQQLGNNPAVFSKIGDCMTDAYFMVGLGEGNYNLGEYGYLKEVVDYYQAPITGTTSNSFTVLSQASYSGLTAQTVLSDEFTSVRGEGVCSNGESMLLCEYRAHKPSVAVIMLGFSETQLMAARDFDQFLRDIVKQTIDHGVIPVLSTFPENAGRKQISRQMNKVIVDLASAYGIPVINLDRALYNLPARGVDSLSHLTIAPIGASNLSGAGLRYGMNVRTLLTLQVLDLVWKDLQKP